MLRSFFVIFILLISLKSFSQNGFEVESKKAGQLKKLAKEAERTGQVYLTLEYYKELEKLDPTDINIQFKIAELYRYTRNYVEAENFYELVCKKGLTKYPEALFYCATMQKANGKYKEAQENLTKFKKVSNKVQDARLKKLYVTELEGCKLATLPDTASKVLISTMGKEINNPHVDFSPIPVTDRELIFGSLREKDEKFYEVEFKDTMHLPVRKFYVGEKKAEDWAFKGEFEGPFNSNVVDIANGTFSLDQTKFYFTKCEQNWQFKTICKIYYSEKKDGKWGEPQLMDEQINMPDFTSTHPTMGRDSKKKQEILYFVSDRPGTKGGMDIWYSEYDNRKKAFKSPKNAGTKINSVGTECTPFFDVKTKTLYYSTDGKANYGGLDMYKSSGEMSSWKTPVNMGTPINSSADDLDLAMKPDGKGGFVVSNRKGGQSLYNATCCDDIYEFAFTNFMELVAVGKIVDKKTEAPIDNVTLSVYIVNGEERYLSEELKNVSSDYLIKLRPGFNYLVEAHKDGFLNSTFEVTVNPSLNIDTVKRNFEMENIQGRSIVIPQLNYEFNSAQITKESKVALDTTLVILLKNNPDLIVEISSHTDNKGTDDYNMKLSQKRAESVVAYLNNKGIINKRLIAKGYGESKPLAANEKPDGTDSPEGRQMNRRTEFKIIGKIDPDLLIQYETNEEPETPEKKAEEETEGEG